MKDFELFRKENEDLSFEEAVLKFIQLEHKAEPLRQKIRKPIDLGSHILIRYNTAEEYKEAFFQAINKPYADIETVKQSFIDEYIYPAFNHKQSGKIYNDIRAGKNINKEDFSYQATKYALLELMRFEGFLNNKEPQQPEHKKTDEVKEVKKELHNHIFKGNAFEVFEKYHKNYNLAENSRTDLNLLYQLFKNDNLFVDTVELKHYIQWLNNTYGYSVTELRKVDINSRPNIQRTNRYKEYKTTTLKQP
ncbi:MAG: hypothetical protein JSS94_03465 [Bacteroidetes bacterium]|nr:hypothetical protein [Bacteroidota bacterium]